MARIPMDWKELREGRRVGVPESIIGKMAVGIEPYEWEKEFIISKGKVYVEAHKKDGKWIKPQLRDLPSGNNPRVSIRGNPKEKVLTEEEKREKLIELLEDKGYTDGTDVDTETALLEYGLIRNPKDDHVIYALVVGEEVKGFDTGWVSLNDVKEYLEEAEEGFYSFIGGSKEGELEYLSNEHLSTIISDINGYDGWFSGELTYREDIDDIIETLD